MNSKQTKRFPTVGCCGIDCGLCPRFHTSGTSRCPGCSGEDFAEKHPSCSIITCCVKKRGLETCAGCEDFPCGKLTDWDKVDSFVTHRCSLNSLRDIKDRGIEPFVTQQSARIRLLETMLEKFDDGRSKSFFCLAAALLPVEALGTVLQVVGSNKTETDKKPLSKLLKTRFLEIARTENIEWVYRKKA